MPMTKMLRHERTAVTFLLRHMVYGIAGGLVFGGLVLAFDIAHLRTLVAASGDGCLTLVLFFFGLIVTFGGVGMGVGVMSLGQDEN